jgi:hypothetical protein
LQVEIRRGQGAAPGNSVSFWNKGKHFFRRLGAFGKIPGFKKTVLQGLYNSRPQLIVALFHYRSHAFLQKNFALYYLQFSVAGFGALVKIFIALKQIGMASGTVKDNPAVNFVNAIYERPIRLNMAFPPPFILTMQGMILVFWKQMLLINEESHYFVEFFNVAIALLH